MAARYRMPLLAKDTIKEALMDRLRGPGTPSSRSLSDAAFAIQFRLAASCLGASQGVILEGNFRPAEHVATVGALMAVDPHPQLIQVLCRMAEPDRRLRLEARQRTGVRHEGHQELSAAVLDDRTADDFLDLPGVRLIHAGGDTTRLLQELDQHLTRG